MGARVLALLGVAGCSFTAGQPAQLGSGSSADAPPGTGGSADAKLPVVDAAIDAKVFLDAPAVTGSIAITSTSYGNNRHDVNLSNEGTTDWAHWGYTDTSSFDHKINGSSISNLLATPSLRFTGAPLTSSWMMGTPHPNSSTNSTGVGCKQGSTMTFTVPAGTSPKTVHVYVGVQVASARLDVSLSDSSATAQTKTYSNSNATDNVEYTITYNAASAGQLLTISWTDTHDFSGSSGFAALLSATLE